MREHLRKKRRRGLVGDAQSQKWLASLYFSLMRRLVAGVGHENKRAASFVALHEGLYPLGPS
jgi:hypothetical protein